MNKKKRQKGAILTYLIIIIAVFMMVMLPVVADFSQKIQILRSSIVREQAFQIAEAGINYYQWHLAHYPNDYYDGTGQPGTYTHNYVDFDTQQKIGEFSLVVTPPPTGSTIVTIKSTGHTEDQPNIKRTVTVKYGIPSLAKYAILNNAEIWIYYSPQVFSGQVQSNNGVRFDVQGNAPVYSAKLTYATDCFGFCQSTERPGVWGSGDSTFWQFPVPAIDFSSFTSNLADMRSLAKNGGIYLPPSNEKGYSLVFNSDGTVSIYKITTLRSNPTGWTYDVSMNWIAKNQYTDYDNRNILSGYDHYAIPSNGIIYAEDNIWVEGTVNGRVTVAAAQLPYNSSTAPTIYIPNNIVYSSKDGSCVLGLIGQKDVIPTYHAPDNLEVDAAVISQNASFQFFYYPGNIKQSISIFGAIIEFGWWFDNFVWTDGTGNNAPVLAGYPNSNYNYDANLLYGPPPSFPFSSSGYQLLDWISN